MLKIPFALSFSRKSLTLIEHQHSILIINQSIFSPEVVPELDGLVEDGLVLIDLDGLVCEGREGRGRGEHGGGQHVAAPEPQGLGAEGEARAPPPPSSCARHCNKAPLQG